MRLAAVLPSPLLLLALAGTAFAQPNTTATPTAPGPSTPASSPPGKDESANISLSQRDPTVGILGNYVPTRAWRGTALNWSNSVSASTLLVGDGYQSRSGQVYSQGYWALLSYYVRDQLGSRVRIGSSPGFDLELTNSNTTTQKRELLFRDLNLTATGSFLAYHNEASGLNFGVLPNATVLLPTSKVSRNQGTYLITSPRVTTFEQWKFRGTGSYPKQFAVGQSFRWDHRFSEATEPVGGDASIPTTPVLPSTTPGTNFTNQYSGVPFAKDSIEVGGWVLLRGYIFDKWIELWLTGSWARDYLYEFQETTCIPTDTGCSPIDSGGSEGLQPAATRRDRTSFGVDTYYFPMPEWGLNLSYLNNASLLDPDGTRQSPFYSPAAVFSLRFIISLDALFDVMTGTPRRPQGFYLSG